MASAFKKMSRKKMDVDKHVNPEDIKVESEEILEETQQQE